MRAVTARRADARRETGNQGHGDVNRALTVPLLWSGARFQVESVDKVQGRVAQRHLVQRRPPVDDVALLATAGVVAVEDVIAEVNAEGSPAAVAAMDRTNPR